MKNWTTNKMHVVTNRMVFAIGLLLFTLNLSAQTKGFIAKSNRSEVPLNQNFQVTYSFENVDGEAFQAPDFSPFNTLSQSSQQSMEFINGKMTRSVSYVFILRPTKEGEFEIPPATAKVDGKKAKSNALKIKVVPANTAQSTPSNPGQSNQGSTNQTIEDQIKDNLFLRAIPNKTTIYEGEQISLTYKVLYLVSVQDYIVTKEPAFNGLLSQDIELSEDQRQRKIEDFKGRQFYANYFKQYAVFPTSSGKFTIDPMEVEWIVSVERNSRSFFRQYDQVRYNSKSNPINITVKPLPTANQPGDFTGVVGKDFTFSVDYDKTETKVDDPITLKIKIAGKGNIKLIGEPKFELPQSFEVYDPEIKESISKKSYTVNGSKSFEYLIVPRGGGEFQFPDITFSYFDLDTEKYVTKVEKGPLVKVEGEAISNFNNNTYNPVSKEEIELLGEDIKFIKTAPITFTTKQKNIIARPIFHLFTWTPLFLALFLPIIYKRRKEANKDQVKVKSKKAHKIANKRLSKAEKLLATNDDKAYYNEIVKSIWGYLADKFNISAADLSKEKAIETLTQKQVSNHLIEDTSKLIDNCEMAIYAPQIVSESKQSIFVKATTLIENLEKEIGNS